MNYDKFEMKLELEICFFKLINLQSIFEEQFFIFAKRRFFNFMKSDNLKINLEHEICVFFKKLVFEALCKNVWSCKKKMISKKVVSHGW